MLLYGFVRAHGHSTTLDKGIGHKLTNVRYTRPKSYKKNINTNYTNLIFSTPTHNQIY